MIDFDEKDRGRAEDYDRDMKEMAREAIERDAMSTWDATRALELAESLCLDDMVNMRGELLENAAYYRRVAVADMLRAAVREHAAIKRLRDYVDLYVAGDLMGAGNAWIDVMDAIGRDWEKVELTAERDAHREAPRE